MLEVIDSSSIETKIKKVHDIARGKKVLVAFSGGVDSSILASLVSDVAEQTILIMQRGDSVGIGEDDFAIKEAEQLGLEIRFIEYDEYKESEEYRLNPHNRCYFCKSLLHSKLEVIRQELDFDLVVNGTNTSDLGGHRPGYQAVVEQGAISPLVEAELIKPEIRRIAKLRGLYSSDKPATPCIASRIKTGVVIDGELLREIRVAEDLLKRKYNFSIMRLRHNGSTFELELGDRESSPQLEELHTYLRENGISRQISEIRRYKPYVPLNNEN